METFLRQTAALGVMTALCRLLLPQGRLRDVSQLTLSLMTTLLLVASASQIISSLSGAAAVSEDAAFMGVIAVCERFDGGYEDIALQTLANQTRDAVKRLLGGYEVAPRAYYARNGGLVKLELDMPYDGAVAELIEANLGVPRDRVVFLTAGGV